MQGIEDIKLLRAESRFQNQWNHMNEVSADVSMRQRKIVGLMSAWTQFNFCDCRTCRLFCGDER